MPVYRPLIGFDKMEIVDISEKINTYETSILPYEDCCTVFTPRHPRTQPELDKVEAQGIFVDGLGVGDVGNIVLRDRQHLSENGLIIIVLTLQKYTNEVLAGPDIVSRGFVYVRESENLLDEAREVVMDALDRCMMKNVSDWGKIKNAMKDSLSEYLWKKMKRNPMILPIIMEVD